MKGVVKSVIFSSAIVLLWISSAQGTMRDRNECPGGGYDRHGYWFVDEKEGTTRCVLKCNTDYEPSGCHVLRRHNKGWNFPEPHCDKKSMISGKVLLAAGAGVGAVVAAPFVLTAAGFGAAGVAAGSLAAYLQAPFTAAGGWFAASQSAGVLGLATGTKAVVASTAGGATYLGSKLWSTCEPE